MNSRLIALLASAEELAGIEPLGWDPSHGAPYEAYSYRRGEDIITVMATPPTEETLGLRLIFGDLGAPSIEGTVEADGLVFTLHSTAGDLRAIQLENVCSEFDAWASASSATVTTAVLMQDLGSVVDGFACPELPR